VVDTQSAGQQGILRLEHPSALQCLAVVGGFGGGSAWHMSGANVGKEGKVQWGAAGIGSKAQACIATGKNNEGGRTDDSLEVALKGGKGDGTSDNTVGECLWLADVVQAPVAGVVDRSVCELGAEGREGCRGFKCPGCSNGGKEVSVSARALGWSCTGKAPLLSTGLDRALHGEMRMHARNFDGRPWTCSTQWDSTRRLTSNMAHT
jgi:hypothetical protein